MSKGFDLEAEKIEFREKLDEYTTQNLISLAHMHEEVKESETEDNKAFSKMVYLECLKELKNRLDIREDNNEASMR